jgi:hypothetical protein
MQTTFKDTRPIKLLVEELMFQVDSLHKVTFEAAFISPSQRSREQSRRLGRVEGLAIAIDQLAGGDLDDRN